MDLLDLFREENPLSPKRALALIEGLPIETMTSALLREEPDSYGWGTETYLLAAGINAVREGTFVNMQVRTKKKLAPPDLVVTPGSEAARDKHKPANAFVKMAQAQLAKQDRS